ncbi:MAG: peptide ABC transporter substrate-binding protein [Spirochaetes bacterium]|nr:peptide ABC transporter substrate-binding protein [Spirochaetota bacterium]
MTSPFSRPCSRALLLLALLPALLLAASAAMAAAGPSPADAAVRELVVAYSPKKVNLDPLHTFTAMESQLFTALYEGLLINDPSTLEPVAGVAESWEASEKGRIWRFTLRAGAAYSNGDPVRAGDFVDSWLRMLNPDNKAEYSFLFDVIKGARAYRSGLVRDAKTVGVRAISDGVLEVELEKPAAHFLKLLCHISFLPLHPSLLKGTDWNDAATVIGNGPFTLVKRTDAEMVLDRNARYWDAKNLGLDRIRIRFLDDASLATDQFFMGRIQWSTIGQYDKLETRDRFEAFPMFATSFFYFTCDAAPWSDWRVRRGLALLLPWSEIRTSDFLFATDRLIPAIPNYPEVKGIAGQQIEEGKRLLADAGFPEGRGLPRLVIKVFSDSTGAEIAGKFAEAWKRLAGLDVVVRALAPDDFYPEMKKTDYALGMSTWIGDYADPLTFLQLWTTGSNLNDARFSDRDYDAAVADSQTMADGALRYRRQADAEEILLTRAVLLPLSHSAAVHLIDLDRIDGWFPNPLDIHPFKFIRFKEKRTPTGIVMGGR